MTEVYSDITQTEFNSSSATLLRVHNNFVHLVNFILMDRLDLCKSILDAQYKEVVPYLHEFPESWQKSLDETQIKIDKIENRYMGLHMLGKIHSPEYMIMKRSFQKVLDDYENLIRMMMEKKGMLMKARANPGSAALNTR